MPDEQEELLEELENYEIEEEQENLEGLDLEEDQNPLNQGFNLLETIEPTQFLAATDSIKPLANIVNVQGGTPAIPAAVTLTSDPSIQDGANGQVLTVRGTSDTNTVTLTTGVGLQMLANITLGINDTITFYFDQTVGDWIEKSRNLYGTLATADTPLSLANGGTAKALTASAGAVVYSDVDSFELTAVGSSGQILKSNGTSAPAFGATVAPNPLFVKGFEVSGTTVTATQSLDGLSVSGTTTVDLTMRCEFFWPIGLTISTIQFLWMANNATSGNGIFLYAVTAHVDAEVMASVGLIGDTAFATSGAGRLNIDTLNLAATGGLNDRAVAGEYIQFRVQHKGTSGSNTLSPSGDIFLYGILVTFA